MKIDFLLSEYEKRLQTLEDSLEAKVNKIGEVNKRLAEAGKRTDYLDLEEYAPDTFRIEIKKPDAFAKLKIITVNKALGVQAVIGFTTEFDGETQAYIFEKKFWTQEKAQQWVNSNTNNNLSDMVLFEKLVAQKKDRALADAELIKKLQDQAAGKGFISHADSIGMKGDALEGDAWTETDKGVTFHDVPFTKEMVQEYPNGKHYKPAEELKKSMDSLRGKPVTAYMHPAEKVVTTMEQQVGHIVFDSVKWDGKGNRPYGAVFIKKNEKNKQLIEDTKKRRLQDVSVGFRCKEVHEPGEFNGEHYDIKQTNFWFDHLALVMQGRAGSADGVGLNAF